MYEWQCATMKEINEDADDEIISGRNKFIKKIIFSLFDYETI
jgi:hypothetical protein